MIPALAALVVRQARHLAARQAYVSGIDRIRSSPIGLSMEDRRAMALVSAACIEAGAGGDFGTDLADAGAEIHELLHRCTQPLGEWLPASVHAGLGLSGVTLIDADESVPTPEALDLARDFSTTDAALEELLFDHFKEELTKQGPARGASLYTAVREFVVRHPLVDDAALEWLYDDAALPLSILEMLRSEFYAPVPPGWIGGTGVASCSACGNAMRMTDQGWHQCRTRACHMGGAAAIEPVWRTAEGLRRASPAIMQFWINPGIDELKLFDALAARGVRAELYPAMDRVDLAVGDIGIDLKAYRSPELLGRKLAASRGGLVHYREGWLVIPDWLAAQTPNYLPRLRTALGSTAPLIECLLSSEALGGLTRA